MPAVSIIMPAYNVGAYIAEAIESAIAQTYSDFELLIVDDGSTDETSAIATRYAMTDDRIKLLRQANGGISSARNQALRLARGELLAILDSDDKWEPEFLAEQVDILNKRPDIDIVTGNAWYLGSPRHGQAIWPTPNACPNPDLETILSDEYAVFIMCVLRRRVFETIGLFDESLRTNEDYDYWLRAAAAGFKFARNDRPLAHYRRRDDSLSANELRMLQGILRVYDKIRPVVDGNSRALKILERQYAKFDAERLAAEARAAIDSRDYRVAGQRLAELSVRRGSPALRAASLLARFAPAVLVFVYHFRRTHLGPAT